MADGIYSEDIVFHIFLEITYITPLVIPVNHY